MGDTPLIGAARRGRTADVVALLADGADVNEPNGSGATALWVASGLGHAEVVTTLLAANADVNLAQNDGITPLLIASCDGHTEIVKKLLAANADVNQPRNGGRTPLYIASSMGHIEVVAELLAANASVNQASSAGVTPLSIACRCGKLGAVQLLSAYGASRTFDGEAPWDTAEHIAAYNGSRKLAAWLRTTRLCSTPLHFLVSTNYLVGRELIMPKRALALLRAGADIHAAAEPGGPTPLSLAQALAAAGGAAEGTAAFLVLEAAKPWSRKTHKYFPEPARARAADLMRVAQAIKRGKAAYEADGVYVAFASPAAVADVFESCVIPHDIASETW